MTWRANPQEAHFSDAAAKAKRTRLSELEKRWDELSPRDQALTWAKDNKFSVVIGSWLSSMTGSWLYIQSQPLSFSQKLVQARVWAQGLTLASLLIMAGITHIPTAGDKILEQERTSGDHSWRNSTYHFSHSHPR